MAAPIGKNQTVEQLVQLIRESFARGDVETVERAAKRLKQMNPRSAFPSFVESHLAARAGDEDRQVKLLRACVRIEPRSAEYRLHLSRALRHAQQTDEAIRHLDEAIRLSGGQSPLRIELADLLEHAGRTTDAGNVIAELLPSHANDPRVALVRANLAARNDDHEGIIDLTAAASDASIEAEIRAGLLFLRGRAFDRLGEPARALETVTIAKHLTAAPFQRERFIDEVNATLSFFTRARLETLPHATNNSSLPLFIATMPRSGSTLLDRIIDAHPLAAGAGELAFFYGVRLQQAAGHAGYPQGFANMGVREIDDIADNYLRRIGRGLKAGTRRLADKSIENYREAGVISLAFPQARMIHLMRNPLDCCLSIFMHPFGGGLAGLTSTLRSIGAFYRQHERCMAHWKNELDLPIHEVRYESLVADPATEVRKMLDFADLPWDDRCLAFHESGRAARTLSYQQVAKPLYTSSVGRAEMYRPYIGDLLEELGLE